MLGHGQEVALPPFDNSYIKDRGYIFGGDGWGGYFLCLGKTFNIFYH